MAVDIEALFDQELPARLAQNPGAAREIGATYQINISGGGLYGEWWIDVSDSGPRVERGNPGTANCTITIAAEDFQKLYENPQANGMQLFFAGKLKVSGNPTLAMKLQKLFTI